MVHSTLQLAMTTNILFLIHVSSLDGVTRRPRENRSYNSRRSSTDSSEDGFNQNVRDLKQELKDMEEKFRKAMVTNASMDNEKSQLMFQVGMDDKSKKKNISSY